ncbi:MAG: c-type cytochrome [Pseudomonadota bacterium]
MGYRSGLFFFCLILPFTAAAEGVTKPARTMDFTLVRCATCHGSDGNASINKAWPKLAGQNAVYFLKALKDFRLDTKHGRKNALMNSIVSRLSEKEMVAIANYYAELPGTIEATQADLVPLGQRLYRGGDPIKGIPACLACHGPAGLGNPLAGFPRLSGQHAAYVTEQLKAFREDKRIDDQHQIMSVIAKKMNNADIEALASYISGLYF